MKKLTILFVLLLSIFLISGCASDKDKKIEQFPGVWLYLPEEKSDRWDIYLNIKKLEEKNHFEIQEISIAKRDIPNFEKTKKGTVKIEKTRRGIIDEKGIIRYEGNQFSSLVLSNDGKEIKENAKNSYIKQKEFPARL